MDFKFKAEEFLGQKWDDCPAKWPNTGPFGGSTLVEVEIRSYLIVAGKNWMDVCSANALLLLEIIRNSVSLLFFTTPRSKNVSCVLCNLPNWV